MELSRVGRTARGTILVRFAAMRDAVVRDGAGRRAIADGSDPGPASHSIQIK